MSERPFSQVAKPLIVAHRGASIEEAENTLEAFDLAVGVGAGAVEFDVRITADGHAVVMHDPTLDRTTDGTGLVSSKTLAEVRASRITLTTGEVARVPTLAETLGLLSGRAAVDVEIKNIPGEPDFDAERELAVEAVHRSARRGGVRRRRHRVELQPAVDRREPCGAARDPDRAAHRVPRGGRGGAALRRRSGPRVGPARSSGRSSRRARGSPARSTTPACCSGRGSPMTRPRRVALGNAGVDAVATNDPRRVVAAVAEAAGR